MPFPALDRRLVSPGQGVSPPIGASPMYLCEVRTNDYSVQINIGWLRDRELNGRGSRIYRDCNFVVGGGSPLRLTGLCPCQGAIYTNLNQPGEQAVSWKVL